MLDLPFLHARRQEGNVRGGRQCGGSSISRIWVTATVGLFLIPMGLRITTEEGMFTVFTVQKGGGKVTAEGHKGRRVPTEMQGRAPSPQGFRVFMPVAPPPVLFPAASTTRAAERSIFPSSLLGGIRRVLGMGLFLIYHVVCASFKFCAMPQCGLPIGVTCPLSTATCAMLCRFPSQFGAIAVQCIIVADGCQIVCSHVLAAKTLS